MRFRVREVLLVSSPYDAFTLEEDGQLSEQLFLEYSELNLSSAPRITHAPTATKARALLKKQRFDLVIAMLRLGDAEVAAFGREVKAQDPELAFVVLGTSPGELLRTQGLDDNSVDGVFLWTGDAAILLAIIKLVEDARNVDDDTAAGVRVILVVEDSVRRYSGFLSVLYEELMAQSASLVAEGVNEVHRLARMRARPKVRLATNLEQATELLYRFEDRLFALITDVRFMSRGKEDPEAGFQLVRRLRMLRPEVPVLIQSAEDAVVARGRGLAQAILNKNDPHLHRKIRNFVTEDLGFGDFVFRMPDSRVVARAMDLYQMEDVLKTVPPESIVYHATNNHFSQWFTARTLFDLGDRLRNLSAEEVGDGAALRGRIIEALRQARSDTQSALIADFSEHPLRSSSPFMRVGKGSVGGKARGLAFLNALLSKRKATVEGIEIHTPRTVAVAVSEYDRFIKDNRLTERVVGLKDSEILEVFQSCSLPSRLRRDLEVALHQMKGPIVVRSSSLLEDAQFQPFAGVYATYILPNSHPDLKERIRQLFRAVKAVYASAFCENARAYMERTPYTVEDEKMGVVLQELVGTRKGDRFYPLLAGVGLSYNYYPMGRQRADEGIVMLVLGLGQQVASGGRSLQFCPNSPGRLPQFPTARQLADNSQREFYALDMRRDVVDFTQPPDASLGVYDLAAAEEDGTLNTVGSVYDPVDDVIRDNLRLSGARVVSFRNILKWEEIPLAPALRQVLDIASYGMGCPVEIEFALDERPGELPRLYVLQIRPQTVQLEGTELRLDGHRPEDCFISTEEALGHGAVSGCQDIIYVKSRDLVLRRSPRIALEVGALNDKMRAEGRGYLLLGPGRWGSSDPSLGIPVSWSQISGAQVIVETSVEGKMVEPSQGSHFFHNITSLHIPYLTVGDDHHLDRDWLDSLPAEHETEHLRQVRTPEPLTTYVDAVHSRAVVLRSSGKPPQGEDQ